MDGKLPYILIALSLHVSVPFVVVHHLYRILFAIALKPVGPACSVAAALGSNGFRA